ncbi:hypothetical protein STEG23_032461 [Scotinomys teguina]
MAATHSEERGQYEHDPSASGRMLLSLDCMKGKSPTPLRCHLSHPCKQFQSLQEQPCSLVRPVRLSVRVFPPLSHSCDFMFSPPTPCWSGKQIMHHGPSKMPTGKKAKGKKVPPPTRCEETGGQKVVNPLSEKRPKNFGIGQDIQPKGDLTRFVKWLSLH